MTRAVVAGVPHHVTQRGNGRRLIFDTDADRLLYLDLLRENAVECDPGASGDQSQESAKAIPPTNKAKNA